MHYKLIKAPILVKIVVYVYWLNLQYKISLTHNFLFLIIPNKYYSEIFHKVKQWNNDAIKFL